MNVSNLGATRDPVKLKCVFSLGRRTDTDKDFQQSIYHSITLTSNACSRQVLQYGPNPFVTTHICSVLRCVKFLDLNCLLEILQLSVPRRMTENDEEAGISLLIGRRTAQTLETIHGSQTHFKGHTHAQENTCSQTNAQTYF